MHTPVKKNVIDFYVLFFGFYSLSGFVSKIIFESLDIFHSSETDFSQTYTYPKKIAQCILWITFGSIFVFNFETLFFCFVSNFHRQVGIWIEYINIHTCRTRQKRWMVNLRCNMLCINKKNIISKLTKKTYWL